MNSNDAELLEEFKAKIGEMDAKVGEMKQLFDRICRLRTAFASLRFQLMSHNHAGILQILEDMEEAISPYNQNL